MTEWEIKRPWNRMDGAKPGYLGKVANPVRFPARLLYKILGKECKLLITDEGEIMRVRVTYEE